MNAVIKPLNGEMVLSLSDEVLNALGIDKGETVEVRVDESGVVRLDAADKELADQLRCGRDLMNRYRETLDILAK